MSQTNIVRRFRVNPVEVVIFLLILLVFGNSVYNLFYNRDTFNPITLTPMNANPISEEGRSLASVSSPTLLNLEVPCGQALERESTATKVRLHGLLCGAEPSEGASKLTKTLISNTTNQFNATVFTDVFNSKYSTDYIPLNTGKNPIHVEFSYQGGKTITQEISVNRTVTNSTPAQ